MDEFFMFSDFEFKYMRQALREAKKGLGRTSPNPCVGAVIVKNNTIIGQGYHKKAGTPHAEIHALRNAGELADGGTMYVTLEPCSHAGKTPPCCKAVAAAGIKKVVIGMLDPNPLVNGNGIEYLREAGIEVYHGLLESECRELNNAFLTYISTGKPWVVMKAGLSLDGKITFRKNYGDAITGTESLRQVHRLRDTSDAILVGIGTVTIDDPSLTARLAKGKGHDPIRIILDTSLRISEHARVVRQISSSPTWIFCSKSVDHKKALRLERAGLIIHRVETTVDGRLNLQQVLNVLGSQQITSLLVEGGAIVHGAFLNDRLVNRACLFYAPVFAGDNGISVISNHIVDGDGKQAIRLANIKHRKLGEDVMICGDVLYPEKGG